MTTRKPYRLKITDVFGNTSYLVRDERGLRYINGAEGALALSNLVRDGAAELRFKLEDAMDGADAKKSVVAAWRRAFPNATREPPVEVLT